MPPRCTSVWQWCRSACYILIHWLLCELSSSRNLGSMFALLQAISDLRVHLFQHTLEKLAEETHMPCILHLADKMQLLPTQRRCKLVLLQERLGENPEALELCILLQAFEA